MQLKVEPLKQWNPGPSFKTYQPQRAKFAAWNSGTNTAVYNFSRFQLTVRQNRGIRCIDQLEIVESAATVALTSMEQQLAVGPLLLIHERIQIVTIDFRPQIKVSRNEEGPSIINSRPKSFHSRYSKKRLMTVARTHYVRLH